jgi:hypothetical protein
VSRANPSARVVTTGFIYSGWLKDLKSSKVLEHFRISKERMS